MAEAAVTVRRPVGEVFAFYRDLTNLPRFLGDVLRVEPLDGARYRWTVQGPLGVRVRWTVEVTEEYADRFLRYETTAGTPGTRSRWDVRFAPGEDPGSTRVQETMSLPFGAAGRALLRLVGKPPQAEAAANLRRLKQLLETGRITDTSHAVRGKFSRPPR